jgi:hypothetical protein
MKIDSSNVSMYSSSSFEYTHQTITMAEVHVGRNPLYGSTNTEEVGDVNALKLSSSFNISMESTTRVVYNYEDNMSLEDKLKKLIIEILLERLSGREHSIPVYPRKNHHIPIYHGGAYGAENHALSSYKEASESGTGDKYMVGALFKTSEEYYQKQTVEFSTSVQIQTPNKSFDMSMSVSFSKELYESHSTILEMGMENFYDPLVINYGDDVNPFENLSDLRFEFDLDNDGESDLIPLLKQGTGFLALDKNNNGEIDNGSELFGTTSGNGFEDLSVYDLDGNNWIDENDEIFNKLKIWQKDEEGNGTLVSLLDLNVGAIYLGDLQSGYKYQSDIATTDAVQQSNGFFVKEDGSGLGMISSLDIAV